MNVKIITDSAADLTKEIYKKYDIDVIPIRVFDEIGNEYYDGVTMEPEKLLNDMKLGHIFKTSLPAYESIRSTLEKYAQSNTPVVHLSLTSELSGTYQSIILVKNELLEEYPNWDIEIIDTKCGALGQGLIVIEAAKMAQENASKKAIMQYAVNASKHMEHVVTVEDLQYFVRGGRVSKFQGFIGGLLNIKPILHLKDGFLTPIEKTRGTKKAMERLVSIMDERGNDLKNQLIGITHANNEDGANELKRMINEKYGCEHFVITTIGATVGAHAGPGTLAVFFLNKEFKLN
ncbi:DegV family protein [Bacillus sp. EAC]|uniref:DegV family protein n=1 Tax=Bacillus sp. EAC TaxID=1978338 RepID=UPI000B4542A1|nr:DegV family protein [Bacillus sp. EAC]